MDIVVWFFLLGVAAGALRVNVGPPESAQKSFGTFLLLAIGLKGGLYLSESGNTLSLWHW